MTGRVDGLEAREKGAVSALGASHPFSLFLFSPVVTNHVPEPCPGSFPIPTPVSVRSGLLYSERSESTGLVRAALRTCEPIIRRAMTMTTPALSSNSLSRMGWW